MWDAVVEELSSEVNFMDLDQLNRRLFQATDQVEKFPPAMLRSSQSEGRNEPHRWSVVPEVTAACQAVLPPDRLEVAMNGLKLAPTLQSRRLALLRYCNCRTSVVNAAVKFLDSFTRRF